MDSKLCLGIVSVSILDRGGADTAECRVQCFTVEIILEYRFAYLESSEPAPLRSDLRFCVVRTYHFYPQALYGILRDASRTA